MCVCFLCKSAGAYSFDLMSLHIYLLFAIGIVACFGVVIDFSSDSSCIPTGLADVWLKFKLSFQFVIPLKYLQNIRQVDKSDFNYIMVSKSAHAEVH